MTNNIVNQYLTRVSHFAGEYIMLVDLREGAENIYGDSGMMLQSIGNGPLENSCHFVSNS